MQPAQRKTTDLKGAHIVQPPNTEGRVNPRRITATTIIGNKVKNNAGQEVGEIEEVVFDLSHGNMIYLVVSSGGLFGIGDKFFAVPMDAFTFDPQEKYFYLDVDKKALKKYKGFDKNDWPMEPQWPPHNGRHAELDESRRKNAETPKKDLTATEAEREQAIAQAVKRHIDDSVYAVPDTQPLEPAPPWTTIDEATPARKTAAPVSTARADRELIKARRC